MRHWISAFAASILLAAPGTAAAQDPSGAAPDAAPPPAWKYTIGAGITLTRGNSDTTSFNASYELSSPPAATHVFTSEGLYLRSSADAGTIANRFSVKLRDEWRPAERGYFFGQFHYLADEFKGIDYLAAPTAGWGYRLVDGGPTVLSIDASAGVVWEGNPGVPGTVSAALSLTQKFSHPISETATMTESASGLWKVQDFDDTLYTFGVGIAAAITPRIRLKVELLDTYKTRPAASARKRNDLAVLASIVFGSS